MIRLFDFVGAPLLIAVVKQFFKYRLVLYLPSPLSPPAFNNEILTFIICRVN